VTTWLLSAQGGGLCRRATATEATTVGCDGCTEDPDARQRGPDGAVEHTHGREEFAWLCQSQVAPSHRVHLRLTEPDHRSVARIYAPRLGPVTPNHRVHRPEAVSRRSRRRSPLPLPDLHEICDNKKHMKLLDPRLSDLTPAHISTAWRYQVVRTLVDFGAAVYSSSEARSSSSPARRPRLIGCFSSVPSCSRSNPLSTSFARCI